MTAIDLLPCPFCGSTATMDVRLIEPPNWWSACIFCDGIYDHICSCQIIAQGDTEQEAVDNAIAAWNRRAEGGYQGFWTHDGTLHIELPKLPESISVRLPDKRDREVHSARVWQYTLGDADATRERHGVGTCKEDETDTVECVCDGIGHYGESLTVHVMECSACGGTYEYVNGSYEYCPRCGAKKVVE